MRLHEADATEEIRCFCARRPLLAMAGRDRRTRLGFVWIRQMKNRVPNVEVIVTGGTIHLRCRDCLRFHRITVTPERKDFYERAVMPEGEPKDFSAAAR